MSHSPSHAARPALHRLPFVSPRSASLLLVGLLSPALHALPPNDECVDALPISLGETGFCTLGATCESPDLPGECERGFGLSFVSTIWYEFVAPSTGEYCLSTCNLADFDTRLAVYVGGCEDLTLIACNDDGVDCSGFTSELTFAATASTTYLIRVGGFSGEGCGTLVLSDAGCPSCPPSDHDCLTTGGGGCTETLCCIQVCSFDPFCCSTAWDAACVALAESLAACGAESYSCPSDVDAPSNDCAPNAIPLPCNSRVPFDTTNATSDGPSIACPNSKDIWFSLTPETELYLQAKVSADFDAVIAVYDLGRDVELDPNELPELFLGCGDASTSGEESISIGATLAGHTYLFQVSGAGIAGTEFGTGVFTLDCDDPLYTTGPNTPAQYDPSGTGSFSELDVGFATGELAVDAEPVWFATPIALPPIDSRVGWHINEVHILGCIPGAADCVSVCAPGSGDCAPAEVSNELMHLIIWSRTGFVAPVDGDQVLTVSVPFPAGFDMLDAGVTNEDLEINFSAPIFLPAGDYWLTAYATSAERSSTPGAFVWLTNSTSEETIPNLDRSEEPITLRSEHFPVPGFEAYALDPRTQLAPASGAPPAQADRLYSAAVVIVGDDEDDCVTRGPKKLDKIIDELGRVKTKSATLSIAQQRGFQDLTEQMFGQFAASDSLTDALIGQFEKADDERLPCEGEDIDIERVLAKLYQLRDLIEDAMAASEVVLADDCVDEGERDDLLDAYEATVDPALALVALLLQQLDPCPTDLNDDAVVDASDLSFLLANWGGTGAGDFDESGSIDAFDLALVLGSWGDCPR